MDVQNRLQAFMAQYTGVPSVGDTPQNKGECVGLIEVWLDQFSLPHIWGDAKDLYKNASGFPAYTLIENTPTNSPSPGDIFVFDWNHTGVVIKADVNTVTLFEQNDPLGSAPQIKTYNYNGAIGWIHPNIFTPTTTQPVTDQQEKEQLNAQIVATNNCLTQLKEATSQNATLQKELTDSENKVKSLTDEKTGLGNQITTLQIQLKGEQEEIVALNETIEKQAASNKNYGQETLDLTHDNQDLTNYLFAIADRMGVNRVNQKTPVIAEAILTKLDEIDLLLKAANVTEGILHEIAVDLGVNPENLSDKEVGDRIIQTVKKLPGFQNIVDQAQQTFTTVKAQPNPFSKFFTWLGLWQPKGGGA